jgi:hypothetical protein
MTAHLRTARPVYPRAVRSLFLLSTSVLLLSGCFLDRSPLDGPSQPRDAGARMDVQLDASMPDDGAAPDAGLVDGGPRDGGVRDGGVRDGGTDAGVDAGVDGGVDGGVDAGPICTPADERCDGDVVVRCTPTGLRTLDCTTREARCVDGAAGAVCEPWRCRPLSTRCSEDGSQVLTCDGTGTSETPSPCVRGCASGACRPRSDCGLAVSHTFTGAGATRFSLCGGGDDADYADSPSDSCGDGFTADGEDRLVRLELDRRRVVHVNVDDVDPDRNVDPVVYVRRRCDDPSTQIACADDGAMLDSRLVTELDAGEYFIVVDSFDYSGEGRRFGCGNVSVTVALF